MPAPIVYARIPGDPAPKGSKSFKGMFKDKAGRMRARMVESSRKVAPWSDTVAAALIGEDGRAQHHFDGAVRLTLEFVLARPAYLDKGKKPKPTPHHTKKSGGDLDKLIRCVKDAITTSGCWRDDSQACEYGPMIKRYAESGEPTGCMVLIEGLPEREGTDDGKEESADTGRSAGGAGKRRARPARKGKLDTAGGALFFA